MSALRRSRPHRPAMLAALALLAAAALGLGTAALRGNDGLRAAVDSTIARIGGRAATPERPVPAAATGGWLLALHDGSVVERRRGQPDRIILPPWSTRPTADLISPGETLGSREIAYDAKRDLLWYGDTHSAIHSIHVATGRPGPELLGFADTSVPGCGITSNARAMAIDPVHDRLIVPTLTGSVLFYDLGEMVPAGGLGVAFFGDVLVGGFRHFAVDPASGLGWYASAAGDLVEVDLARPQKTGRVIPFARQEGAPSMGGREIAIDPVRRLLVYRTEDRRLAAFDLRTLRPVAPVQADPIEGLGAFAYLPR